MSEPNKVLFNGQFYDGNSPVLPVTNRAFRYGDGLFESIRIVNGKVCHLDAHYRRLAEGLEVLRMPIPEALSLAYLREKMDELIAMNNIHHGGVARLHVFRESGDTYAPQFDQSGFVLRITPHNAAEFELNEQGVVVDVYPDMQKPINILSRYKTANALLYIMAAMYAREKSWDDALIVNGKGQILESTASNLFIATNGVLYTPALEDGCVGGIMRMTIINLALKHNMKVYECSLTPQQLLTADEAFLTNAISGVRWIKSYRNKRYYNKTARFLVEKLNEKVSSLRMDLQGN